MPLHLQSVLHFSTKLVIFLIIPNCSLLLALGLINCGASLEPFLHLCLWLPRCHHLIWPVTFLATPQPLDSCPLHHQITSPWLLPTGRLIRSIRISDWHWCCCSYHSWHKAAHFSPQSFPCWYSFLSTQFWGRSYTCVWYVLITSQGSWHSGQCCVQTSWELSTYFSTCLILLPGSIVRSALHNSLSSQSKGCCSS